MGNAMNREELDEILRRHKLWLEDDPEGVCANLTGANLTGANLTDANLTDANLEGAKMTGAKMTGAKMTGAKMTGAKIDYCSWPLWCGSLGAHVDDRIAIQLLYHTLSVVQNSPYVSEEVKKALLSSENVRIANRFHRVGERGKIEEWEEEE